MISFVWPSFMTFVPWAGGSEVYTMEHIRELQRRNIPARLIACNQRTAQSMAEHSDIPYLEVENESALSELDDTLIFVMHPMRVMTKNQAYAILHTTLVGPLHDDTAIFANKGMGDTLPIATSNYMARYWEKQLGAPHIPVVYPAADKVFSDVPRPPRADRPPRVLFAGRPTQEKGVFTLLASLGMPPLRNKRFEMVCVKTMNHNGDADVVHALFGAHPQIRTIPAGKDREAMAKIYAEHDIVIMPSSSVLWKEAFGMISIEAQHAGCRVVASDDGGLPETDCGALLLVKPDDPLALAEGIARALTVAPVTKQQRQEAAKRFTPAQSVDSLLQIIRTK